MKWECKYTDSLADSMLVVEGYESNSDADVKSELTEQHRNYQSEFTIDLRRDSVIAWRGKSENQDLTSEELAARFLSYLLGSIRRGSMYKN